MITIFSIDVAKMMGITVMRQGRIVYTDEYKFETLVAFKKHLESLFSRFKPDISVCGRPNRFYRTLVQHSRYMAILELICEDNQVQYHEIMDSSAKKVVLGKGNIKKEEVLPWAQKKFNLEGITGDQADSMLFAEYIHQTTKKPSD